MNARRRDLWLLAVAEWKVGLKTLFQPWPREFLAQKATTQEIWTNCAVVRLSLSIKGEAIMAHALCNTLQGGIT